MLSLVDGGHLRRFDRVVESNQVLPMTRQVAAELSHSYVKSAETGRGDGGRIRVLLRARLAPWHDYSTSLLVAPPAEATYGRGCVPAPQF